MPLPDERPRGSVANLIGRFEQQSKRASIAANSVPPLPVSHAAPRKSNLNVGIGQEALNGSAKEKIGTIDAKKDEKDLASEGNRAEDIKSTTVIDSANEAAPAQTAKEPGPISPPASEPVVVSSGASAAAPPSSPPRKATTVPTTASPSKPRSTAPTVTPKATPTSRTKPLPPSTSSSLSKSRLPRPDSRASTTSSPAPRASSTTPRTVPLSTALSAPTASSLAKARSPPTAAAASPVVRRLSSTKKEASIPGSAVKGTPSSSNVTPAKKAIPVRATTPSGRGRGTVKPRVGLAGAGLKKPTKAATLAAQVSPSAPVPEGTPLPGGDPETSTAVAQRELQLITAQVPPLVTQTEDGELIVEPAHAVETEVVHDVDEERPEEESHPEVIEMEAFGKSTTAEPIEELEHDTATLEPQEITLPAESGEMDLAAAGAQLATDRSQDATPPPQEVLESVPLDGIVEVDASKGIIKLGPELQEHQAPLDEEDEEEGVAVIPDEE